METTDNIPWEEYPQRIENFRIDRQALKHDLADHQRVINRTKAEYKTEARSSDTEPSNRDERKHFVKQKKQSTEFQALLREKKKLESKIEELGARIERLRREFELHVSIS